MKEFNIIHTSYFDCLEDCIVSMLNYYDKKYDFIFCRSWRVIPWEEQTYNAFNIKPDIQNIKYLLEKYYHVHLQENIFHNCNEFCGFMELQLKKGNPVIAGVDMYSLPWSGYCGKIHELHYIVIHGMTEDRRYITADITQNMQSVVLTVDDISMIRHTYHFELNGEKEFSPDTQVIIDECKSQLQTDVEVKNGYRKLREFAENFWDYKEEIQVHSGAIETSPFLKYLLSLSKGRIAFAKILEAADREEYYDIITSLKSIGAQWGNFRLQIMKALIQNTDSDTAGLSGHLIELIEGDEMLYRSFTDDFHAAGNNHYGNASIAVDKEQTFEAEVILEKYFNNTGFGSYRNFEGLGFDGCGFFYAKDDKHKEDNISCRSQKVVMNAKDAIGIKLWGSAEKGNFSEKFIIASQNKEKEYKLNFSDWREESIFGEKIVKTCQCLNSKTGKNEGDCYIFEQTIRFETDFISYIILPECENIHLFRILAIRMKS
ncbi:cysteine peptidase family C39 domain-containing protein [Anaerocolumna xylanovorans]|uniref:Butirosin biosynthesis protein H, N-terminal n=1 Tax=Anaerocolumna xylanovorans DSM 12503 TaxID=1121345 RepID=A0A1M7YE98_9FIRM|nr:BtrH N-terminal domain-containing protein [Anaerocolumna xylanovorans]SHO50974.1 hypothetical protein SAMN02745217_02994 [Anaerocolumna xylanovorans DSM 12503]